MNQIVKNNQSLTPVNSGLGIEGLEDVPTSVLPVPYVKLVQGMSVDIQKKDGEDAKLGSYFHTDTQEEVKSLRFVLLRALVRKVLFEGEKFPKTRLNILGYDLDKNKVFILTLSVMSISNFGKLVAQMKAKNVSQSWEYEVVATSSIETNDKKQKFYVANFQLGEKVAEEKLAEMETNYRAFGAALNREEPSAEEKAAEEVFSETVDPQAPVDEPADNGQPTGSEDVKDEDLPF